MKIVIRITPSSLDVIQAMNGGVRPKIESHDTYFVVDIKDAPVNIVDDSENLGSVIGADITLIEVFEE